MNVYMVRSDGEHQLYAALDCFHAIELDEQAFVERELAEFDSSVFPPPPTDELRERYRREIFDEAAHVGELANWPKAVVLAR